DLRHVFVNLLLNARDAMPGGGRVEVTARVDRKTVEVRVADEGTGIAREDLGRVFDPFFTTKGERGSGLGLSIAYAVMTRLGGSIKAENCDGRGACFTLSFPALGARELAAPEKTHAVVAGGRPRRVLLVEDDKDIGETTC